jgi:hypothetical protein
VGRGATRRWPAGGGRCKRGKLSRGGTINTREESRAPRVCAGRRGGRAPNYGTDLAVETRGAGGRAVRPRRVTRAATWMHHDGPLDRHRSVPDPAVVV